MKRTAIKVKAMGFFAAHGRLLVTPSYDSVKRKPYFRLLGGHVEFGERAETTLRREMREELDTDVEVLERLDVIQNIFQYQGRDYHEIVFLHHARFLDDAITRMDELRNLEAGYDEIFRWLPVKDVLEGERPLYPAADYRRFLERIGAADGA